MHELSDPGVDKQREVIAYYVELARANGLNLNEDRKAALPTYSTVADVLEKKNGSGIRLFWWSVARVALIAPPFMLVGVPMKQAFGGAAIASGLISVLTLARIADARNQMEHDVALVGREPPPRQSIWRGRRR
jgi:hypothetical protein